MALVADVCADQRAKRSWLKHRLKRSSLPCAEVPEGPIHVPRLSLPCTSALELHVLYAVHSITLHVDMCKQQRFWDPSIPALLRPAVHHSIFLPDCAQVLVCVCQCVWW